MTNPYGGATRDIKNQSFKSLMDDAFELYQDQPKEVGDLIYWALSLEDDARLALIMAYQKLRFDERMD